MYNYCMIFTTIVRCFPGKNMKDKMRAARDAKDTRFPTAAPGWSAVLTGGTFMSG